jgi:hypothetical protein
MQIGSKFTYHQKIAKSGREFELKNKSDSGIIEDLLDSGEYKFSKYKSLSIILCLISSSAHIQ